MTNSDESKRHEGVTPPHDDGTMFSMSPHEPPPPTQSADEASSERKTVNAGKDRVAPPDDAATLFSLTPSSSGGGDTVTDPGTAVVHTDANAVRERLVTTPGGRYEVRDELGRGGMGVVRTAFDRNAQRNVAIKHMLAGTPQDRERRFLQEGQVTAQLEHPAVVPVHDVGIDEHGQLFFAMKLVHGESLRERIDRAASDVRNGVPAETAFPVLQRLDVIRRVGEALAFAHSRGVIHRDLKPDNVMLGAFGEVLVMDWGLARVRGAVDTKAINPDGDGDDAVQVRTPITAAMLTADGTISGTPAYMSPEQARGDVVDLDERSDVYALGALLYELLTFTPPFRGNAVQVLSAVRAGTIDPPADRARETFGARAPVVPRELAAVVARSMANRASDRYESATALNADIEAWLSGRALEAVDYSTWQLVAKWIGRHRLPVGIGAAAALVLAVMGVIFVLNLDRALQDAMRQRDRADEQMQLAEQRATEVSHQMTIAEQRRAESEANERRARLTLDNLVASRADFEEDPLRSLVWLAESTGPWTAARRLVQPPSFAAWQGVAPSDRWLTHVAVSRDAQLVVALRDDLIILLYDHHPHPCGELRMREGDVPYGIRVTGASPDIRLWVATVRDGATTISAFDLQPDRELSPVIWRSPPVTGPYHGFDIASHDGGFLVAIGGSDAVVYHTTREGEQFRVPDLSGDVAFSPDGRRLGARVRDDRVQLWRVDGWEALANEFAYEFWLGTDSMVIRDDDFNIVGAQLLPDGTIDVGYVMGRSGTDGWLHPASDHLVIVRDRDYRALEFLATRDGVDGAMMFPRGMSPGALALTDRYLAVGTAVGLELWRIDPHTRQVRLLPDAIDGRLVFVGDGDGLVGVTRESIVLATHGQPPVAIANPTGRFDLVLTLPGRFEVLLADSEGASWVHPVHGPVWRRTFPEVAKSVAVSPDGRWLVASLVTDELLVLDFDSGTPIARIAGAPAAHRLAFTPDSDRLLLVSQADADGPVQVATWQTSPTGDWRRLRLFELPADTATARFEVLPDGERLAVMIDDVALRIHDLATGELRIERAVPGDVRLLPDGRSVVEVHNSSTVHIVTIDSGIELARGALIAPAWEVAPSPDGTMIACASEIEGMVHLLGGGPSRRGHVQRLSGFVADMTQMRLRPATEREDHDLRERYPQLRPLTGDPPAAAFWRAFWHAVRAFRRGESSASTPLDVWLAENGDHPLASVARDAGARIAAGRDPAIAWPAVK